jgi:hypothetical protein
VSDEINDQETPAPETPSGAAPSFDPEIADKLHEGGAEALNGNGAEYLQEKGDVMSPEALLNRFKQMSEVDNPGMAVLVTEVQELKAYSHRIGTLMTAALPMLTACAICAIILTSRILAEGDSE